MADQQSQNEARSKVWVVLPAAGIGSRMQMDCPKQYLKIHGKTLIEHTLDCFLQHRQVSGVVVVISEADTYWETLNIESNNKKIVTTTGGKSRSESVMRGLNYLSLHQQYSDSMWVMVHDAARPCLSQSDIDALLALRETSDIGGLLASPVRDTMKRVLTSNAQQLLKTESRENLWHALTPQLFRISQLKEALLFCQENQLEVTDESSAMEHFGVYPMIVQGSHNNIKVTQASDVALASHLLSAKFHCED